MEISVHYTIGGKFMWHRCFEFSSTGLSSGVFHSSLPNCHTVEDTGALSRHFLHLSSLRERKSIAKVICSHKKMHFWS